MRPFPSLNRWISLLMLFSVALGGCQSIGLKNTTDVGEIESRQARHQPAEVLLVESPAVQLENTSPAITLAVARDSEPFETETNEWNDLFSTSIRQTTPLYRLRHSPFDRPHDEWISSDSTVPNHWQTKPMSPVQLASLNAESPDISDGTSPPSEWEHDDAYTIDETPIFATDVRTQFRNDVRGFLPEVWNDTQAIANWHNGAWILGATGIALALRADADGKVREYTAEHPDRWEDGSHVLGTLGDVQWQVPAILLVYGNSIWTEDVRLYDFSRSLISAYTITGVSTVAIKSIANTERPSDEWNNGEFGFPSFHTSSSFTIAAVIDEYYGIEKAAPMYVLAGLIGWSRIDERDHDLSDVVFGAMLGYIVGKSVAAYHLHDDPRVRIRPTYSQINETYGVVFETSY